MGKRKIRRPNFRTCCLGVLPAVTAGVGFFFFAMIASGLISVRAGDSLSPQMIAYIGRVIAVASVTGVLMGSFAGVVYTKELRAADFPRAMFMAVLLGVGLMLVNENGDLLLLVSGITSLIWAVVLFGLRHIYAEGERHSNAVVPPRSPTT